MVAAVGERMKAARMPCGPAQLLEAEGPPIEVGGRIGVADEEDRVVQAGDRHWSSAPASMRRSSPSHSRR